MQACPNLVDLARGAFTCIYYLVLFNRNIRLLYSRERASQRLYEWGIDTCSTGGRPAQQVPLRYSYKSDPAAGSDCASTGDSCDKALAEGWAFAAAVLPRLNYCDSSVAKLVKDNLDVTAITGAATQASPSPHMRDGYAKLKEEVEMPSATLRCFEVAVLKSLPFLGHTRRLLADYMIQLHSNPKFTSNLM